MQPIVFGLGLFGCAHAAAPQVAPPDEVAIATPPDVASSPTKSASKRVDDEAPEDIAGAWVGTYVRQVHAPSPGAERSSVVAFTLDLVVDHTRLRGRMTEHGLADDDDDGDIAALVEGVLGDDGIVRFTKHYAPSTGLSGIGEYVGRHDAVTGRIEGTWSTDGASGRFSMHRDRPGPQLARRAASPLASTTVAVHDGLR